MDIQEHELVAPAEGLVGRKSTLTLGENEKLSLVNWATSTEYKIFLRLAESIIERSETSHLRTWKDKEAFERTGLVAVAQRLFFERLQKEVNNQYDEFAGELEFVRQEKGVASLSPEQRIQDSL